MGIHCCAHITLLFCVFCLVVPPSVAIVCSLKAQLQGIVIHGVEAKGEALTYELNGIIVCFVKSFQSRTLSSSQS